MFLSAISILCLSTMSFGCPSSCPTSWLGDGECDSVCDNAECSYDNGDCSGCPSDCPTSWLGDGECDSVCNNADCNFDNGDCAPSECSAGCASSLLGDGSCDSACNNNDCNCDGGDCGISDGCVVDNCNDDANNLNCAECTVGTPSTCTVCNIGYSLSETATCATDQCNDDSNNPNCLTCTVGQANTCTLCNDGSFLSEEGSCVSDQCNDDANNPDCLACTVGTADSCTLCNDGKFLFEQSCIEDECSALTDCLLCTDTSVCTACISGVELSESDTCVEDTCTATGEDENCLTCDTPGICTVCASGFELTNDACVLVSCPDGQYVENNACADCKTLCNACTDSSDCTACVEHADLVDSTCSCVEYSTYDSSTDSCVCSDSATSDGTVCVPLGDYLPSTAYTSVSFTSDECGQLEVRFNTAVTIVDASDTDCDSLFQPATVHILGENPSCSWSDDKRTLTVDLDHNYDFTAATVNIEVNWRHVRQSSNEVDRSYATLSRTINKSSCPTPAAIISAPSKYSSACTDSPLELLASVRTGFGHSPVTYSWTVSPILTDLSTAEESEVAITVPDATSGFYTFTVTVTNTFGKTGTATAEVTISDTESLTLTFDTSSEVTIKGGQRLKVKPSVTADCGASGSARYEWSFQRTVSGEEATIPSDIETTDSKLALGKNDLKPGEGYVFRCDVTQSDYETYEEITVTVDRSELIPRLNLGNQDISSGVDLELDASDSEDPDGETLYFVWTCVHASTGNTCLNTEGSFLISETTPLTTAHSLSVASENLTPDDELLFTVTISTDDGRSESKSVTLTVKDAGDSSIEVVPIQIQKLLVHQGLVITLHVRGVQIEWAQSSGPTLTPSSSTNLPSVRFAPNTMEQGSEYTFRATLSTSGTAQIAVEISWVTNMGPICFDSLSTSLETGNFYSVSIADCFDLDEEDYPLTFSFGTQFRGRSVPLSSPTSFEYLTTYFVPATYTVSVTVCDAAGSCITEEMSTTLGTRRLESVSLQEEYLTAYSGDDDQIPMLVKMFAGSYECSEDDWDFLHNKLYWFAKDELSDEGEYDISVATGMTAALLELLAKATTEEQVTQGLELINDIVDNLAEPFDEEFFELVLEVLGGLDTSGSVFSALLTTEGVLNRLMINGKLPGESVTFGGTDQSMFTGLYRSTSSSIGDSSTVSFTTSDGAYEIEYGALTTSSSHIIDLEVLIVPADDNLSSPTIDILFYTSGTYDANTLELNVQEGTIPLDTSSLAIPFNITLPFETSSNITYMVSTLNSDGEWERDNTVTLTIVDSSTVKFQTPHASSFKIVEVPNTSSEECEVNLLALYIMAGWITICTLFIVVSRIFDARASKRSTTVQDQVKTNKAGQSTPENKELFERTFDQPTQEQPKKPSLNFISAHLVLGQCSRVNGSKTARGLELMANVLVNLALVGIFLLALETPREVTADDYSDTLEYILVAVLAAAVAWFCSLVVDLMLVKASQSSNFCVIGWLLLIFESLVSIIATCLMTLDFCDNWTYIWVCLTGFAVAIDCLLLQSLTALAKVCIERIKK